MGGEAGLAEVVEFVVGVGDFGSGGSRLNGALSSGVAGGGYDEIGLNGAINGVLGDRGDALPSEVGEGGA